MTFETKALGDFYSLNDLNRLKDDILKFKSQLTENQKYCYKYPAEHYDEISSIKSELEHISKALTAADSLVDEIDDIVKYLNPEAK